MCAVIQYFVKYTCKKYACKKTSYLWLYFFTGIFMISLPNFSRTFLPSHIYSDSELEEQLTLELKKVTKRANKKWRSERKQRFKTKDVLYTLVENCVTGHAMPMWVRYSKTQTAETYLLNQETILVGRRLKDIPVKSMSKGTLDGFFYLPKYDQYTV